MTCAPTSHMPRGNQTIPEPMLPPCPAELKNGKDKKSGEGAGLHLRHLLYGNKAPSS